MITTSNQRLSTNINFFHCELAKHFPNISRHDLSFVRNPYLVSRTDLISNFSIDDENQDEFIATKND